MADDRIGWEINGIFYPHVGADALLQGDYALIWELTGVNLDDFAEEGNFKLVELGWIGAAFWHGNTEMRRSQVVKILERLPDSAIIRVGFEQEADDGPPAEGGESTSISSSSTTTVEQQAEKSSATGSESSATASSEDSTPEQSTLNGSGDPLSDTGATSPLETWARSTNVEA